MGHYESSAKRKVHSTKCPHQINGGDLTAQLKGLEKKKKQTLPGRVEDWK